MVPADFRALARRRADRALLLAARFPASDQALGFAAAVALLQESLPETPLEGWPLLRDLVFAVAPDRLRTEAAGLDRKTLQDAVTDYQTAADTRSPRSVFARILLQPGAACGKLSLEGAALPGRCPACGHPPQAGVLKSAGHGDALSLACSLCFGEWPFPRGVCAACGESRESRLSYFSTESLPHVRLSACDTCRAYYHSIDRNLEPTAIADIDELTALPLDLWAAEQGYTKIQPNLAGI